MANPGGLGFIRFHDSDFEVVSLGLKRNQSILKSSGGYVMGVARKNAVSIISGTRVCVCTRLRV